MKTLVLPAQDTSAFAHAVRLLRAGKVIVFPTDTVYGVGAHGWNEAAIRQLFIVKERPLNKAIPYLIADRSDLETVSDKLPEVARKLADKFWPGGLTLIVPANRRVPRILTADQNSVAVRVPDNRTTLALIDSLGAPLAATSANISGENAPATAQQALEHLGGRVAMILDGGPTQGNVPSTVIDLTKMPPTVLREGVISFQELSSLLGGDLGRAY